MYIMIELDVLGGISDTNTMYQVEFKELLILLLNPIPTRQG